MQASDIPPTAFPEGLTPVKALCEISRHSCITDSNMDSETGRNDESLKRFAATVALARPASTFNPFGDSDTDPLMT